MIIVTGAAGFIGRFVALRLLDRGEEVGGVDDFNPYYDPGLKEARIQALLERELRKKLAERGAPPLKLYPEDRDAPHPTTSQLFKTFDRLSTYRITQEDGSCEQLHDELNETQRQVLSLLDIPEESFWQMN